MPMFESKLAQVLSGARMLAFAALAVSHIATPVLAASSQDVIPPGTTRTMTAVEIYLLYRGKSWQWENGAGRMTEAGRRFSAWSDGEGGISWAEGRWAVTETGLMCMIATWHSDQGAFPAKTCFSHRVGKGTIYQKREPDGEWYVFRHSVPREDDEASNLVSEDLVSQQREAMKATLVATQISQQ